MAIRVQWRALTQVRVLHFLFLTFLLQENRGVWCPEWQTGRVVSEVLMEALLISLPCYFLPPTPFLVFTLFCTLHVA